MTTKDVVLMFTAVGSLIVTVVWNLQNRWHTDNTAKRIRIDAFKLDEWKSHRTEILRALREFEDVADRLMLLSRGAQSQPDLLAEIDVQGRALTKAHLVLIRELERAEPSGEWTHLAYGQVQSGESDWDQLNSIIVDASSLEDASAMRQRLEGIAERVQGIARLVNEEIRVKNAEHDPDKY